jgi:HSP20 family protein
VDTPIRWNPFRTPLAAEGTNGVGSLLRSLGLHAEPDDMDTTADLRIDLIETEDGYRVVADLPGASRDDIDVFLDGSCVTIHAEPGRGLSGERRGRTCTECGYRTHCSFVLPWEVDASSSNAEYGNGVLSLVLRARSDCPASLVLEA